MTIQPAPAAPTAIAPTVGSIPRRRPVATRLGRWAFRLLLLGLILFNALWYFRDIRPLASPDTITQWIKQGRYEEAKSDLIEKLRRSPNDGSSRFRLAQVLSAQDEPRARAEQLHMVPFWSPNKSLALQYEGENFFRVNRARDAEAAWKECMKDDPLHPIPTHILDLAIDGLINLYIHEERLAEAHEVFWMAYAQSGPEYHLDVMVKRMRSEVERITPENAAVRLRQFVAADPEDWEALRALARVEQALGKADEARRNLSACLKAWPDDPRVWVDWMTILQKQGDVDALAGAVDKVPSEPAKWRYQGRTKQETPALVAADAETLAEIWKFKGIVRERKADFQGAADAYRRAIALHPFREEYFFRGALAENRLGHAKEAKRLHEINLKLRQARSQVDEVNRNIITAVKRPGPEVPPLGESIRRMATLCETLGWKREAAAWLKLIPKS